MDEDEIQDKVEDKAQVEDRVEDGVEELKIKRTMGTRSNTHKYENVQASLILCLQGKRLKRKGEQPSLMKLIHPDLILGGKKWKRRGASACNQPPMKL